VEESAGQSVPRPTNDEYCFVCGKENPIGLKTSWSLQKDGTVRASFYPSREHQGWSGILHGGILAALLDEAMAQRMGLVGKPSVTASLKIRFRKPAPTSGTLVVEARILSEGSTASRLEASVRADSGECFAEAEGTCVRIKG
jgi:uncharacterized protein (TIGR00369 family)